MAQYGGNYGLTQFEFDAERDLKDYRVWIADLFHFPVPPCPLEAWLWCDGISHGMQYGAEMMSMPETKGWDMRLIKGTPYLGIPECRPDESVLYLSKFDRPVHIPKQVDLGRVQRPEFRAKEFFIAEKPEDVPTREQLFRERVKPILDDYDGEWKNSTDRWMGDVNYFKERCHPEDLEEISNAELWELLEDALVRIHRGWWAIHMIWMYPVYGIYNLFGELFEELTGMDIEEPLFKSLLSGFDNLLFRENRLVWQFGDRARELGLADVFLSTADNDELLAKLGQSDGGRKWLAEYHEFLKDHGFRLEMPFDITFPTWLEQPSYGLRDVRIAIMEGGVFTLDVKRERLAEEREKAEKEILAKVPAEQRDWFAVLMKAAQKSGCFSEEHNLFFDVPANAVLRHIFMEYGRRFSQAGVIDEQEDILCLFPWEIRKAAVCMERINLRPYVQRYKKEWEQNREARPEPFIGDIATVLEVARKNALVRVIAVPPRVRPELKADLYGASSAPGVVEGTARVIMTATDLGQVQPGEILVAPMTSIPWTPVFGIIGGVVTDAGGSLSHAAIVAREYSLPAVIGTQEATRKIKTGDKIRVDGTNNAVYILG